MTKWVGAGAVAVIVTALVALASSRFTRSSGVASPSPSTPGARTTPPPSEKSTASDTEIRRFLDPQATSADGATISSSAIRFTIRVRDAGTRATVPNAEVRWAAFDPDTEWPDDEDALIATSGGCGRTDERGEISIPDVGDRILVHARFEELFGRESFVAVSERFEGREILLRPDYDVTVHVVDRSHRDAADVSVALRYKDESSPVQESEAATDAAGLAVLRHVGYRIADLHATRASRNQSDPCWEIGLGPCLPKAIAERINGATAPHRRIEFELPACGSVILEGVDTAGKPIALMGDALLAMNQWAEDLEFNEAIRGRIEDGRLVFAHVGLGLSLAARARRNGASQFAEVDGTGPERESEGVTLRVVVGADRLRLHGRVADDAGRPLAGVTMKAWIVSQDRADGTAAIRGPYDVGYDELGSFTTSRDGSFEIDAFPWQTEFPELHSLVLAVDRNRPEAREARIALCDGLSTGDADVGVVRLEPAPVTVAGTVVDESGRPVAGCRIEGPEFKNSRSGVHTTTDEHGRFELRGILLDKQIGLTFRAPRHCGRWIFVEPGGRDLVVLMPRSGGFKARFRLPPGCAKSQLSISLRHEDDGGDGTGGNLSSDIESDEELFEDDCWPGSWTLLVSNGGRDLLKKSDVNIRGGEITDLGEIALASNVTTIHVAVTSATTGEPLEGAYLVRPRGTGKIEQLFVDPSDSDLPREFTNGRIRIVATEDAVDVVVIAVGHQAVVLLARAGEQDLRLPPAIHVPLRIADFRRLLPAPRELRLVFRRGDSVEGLGQALYDLRDLGQSSLFDRDGRAEVLLPAPGRWSLEWQIVDTTDSGTYIHSVEGRDKSIEIGADATSHELLLDPGLDASAIPVGDH